MNRVSFELIDKVEISTAFLECAIDGLSLFFVFGYGAGLPLQP